MRTYVSLPDGLRKDIEAIAERSGLNIAAQIKVLLSTHKQVEDERWARESNKYLTASQSGDQR